MTYHAVQYLHLQRHKLQSLEPAVQYPLMCGGVGFKVLSGEAASTATRRGRLRVVLNSKGAADHLHLVINGRPLDEVECHFIHNHCGPIALEYSVKGKRMNGNVWMRSESMNARASSLTCRLLLLARQSY